MMHEIVEVCPNCEREVSMQWDVQIDGFKAFCPYCRGRLMLCDECLHESGEAEGGSCDYCRETDSCKRNPRRRRGRRTK